MSTNWQVHIAMVGKYTGLSDSYLSVLKVHLVITSYSKSLFQLELLCILIKEISKIVAKCS